MAELELIVKENLDVALLFVEKDELKKKLKEIETEVMAVVPDLSTAKGRKEIASLAFKVAKSKVVLDNLGKDLVSEWKTKASKVDESRKYARDFLDSLKDRVRQPLTDWEAAEEARVKAEAEAAKYASDWDEAHKDHEHFLMVKELERKAAELEAMKAAQLAKEQAEREAEEARQAKAARKKQAEIDEANRIAREKRIAEEAAAMAKKDAEERLEAERKAAEQRLIDAEAKRIRDLVEAKAKAEAEKKAIVEAEERAKVIAEQKRLADIQAEKDKAEAEKKAMIEVHAKKDREAAELAAKEQARIAAEKAEEKERQENVAHQKRVNNEAIGCLIQSAGVDEPVAKRVLVAIAKGQIANVFIRY